MIKLRKSQERGHANHGWLDSYHSFSFAEYFDAAHMQYSALRVINEDVVAGGKGFGMHPHADMEIITVMLAGELHHQDSMGHSQALRCGEVQRMTAGSGIVHSETNPSAAPCHLLQIWIEPSGKDLSPSYEQKPFVIERGWTLLIDPQGQQGAMAINRPVRLWRARAGADQELGCPVAPDAQGWIQMITGEVTASDIASAETPANQTPAGAMAPSHSFQGEAEAAAQATIAVGPIIGVLRQGDGLGFAPGRPISLEAGDQGADLLLFELR